jgi:hypothetical protein
MVRVKATIAAALCTAAYGNRLNIRRAEPATVNVQALKSSVLGSKVFEDKVAQLCQGAGEDCAAKAGDALFCQLLERHNPTVAAAHCGKSGVAAPASAKSSVSALQIYAIEPPPALAVSGKLASLKAKIVASDGFKRELKHMAGVLGCDGMRKEAACVSYVEEVAFCFAFADKFEMLANTTGVAEETQYCKKIDEKVPKLSMLLQQWKRARPVLAQLAERLERRVMKAPEDDLAREMTHDLEMNFNKIAPFGKEDTAKELQDHAAKTQDTLVDAVENAEVAEIKRAVFRALTRLRAATIKEFDTIARLETQAIDAYNDAHHYRAENPLAHLHEDEAPVETDKLKSFH